MSTGADVIAKHLETIAMSAHVELKARGWKFRDGAEERIAKAVRLLPTDMESPLKLFNEIRAIIIAEKE